MRFKKLKMSLATGMMAVMMLASTGSAFAADSRNYEVNYQKGAPTTTANPVCKRTVRSTKLKYWATSPTFSGSDNRIVKIDGGGMSSKYITVSNRNPSWKVSNYTDSRITYTLTASGSASCRAAGTINSDV